MACSSPGRLTGGVYLAFPAADFLKGFEKCFSRNYLNALKNHNLLNIASKIVKQILVDFVRPDL
jgi:hypothetical protein